MIAANMGFWLVVEKEWFQPKERGHRKWGWNKN